MGDVRLADRHHLDGVLGGVKRHDSLGGHRRRDAKELLKGHVSV